MGEAAHPPGRGAARRGIPPPRQGRRVQSGQAGEPLARQGGLVETGATPPTIAWVPADKGRECWLL